MRRTWVATLSPCPCRTSGGTGLLERAESGRDRRRPESGRRTRRYGARSRSGGAYPSSAHGSPFSRERYYRVRCREQLRPYLGPEVSGPRSRPPRAVRERRRDHGRLRPARFMRRDPADDPSGCTPAECPPTDGDGVLCAWTHLRNDSSSPSCRRRIRRRRLDTEGTQSRARSTIYRAAGSSPRAELGA